MTSIFTLPPGMTEEHRAYAQRILDDLLKEPRSKRYTPDISDLPDMDYEEIVMGKSENPCYGKESCEHDL